MEETEETDGSRGELSSVFCDEGGVLGSWRGVRGAGTWRRGQ
jgi:hypothetical protein